MFHSTEFLSNISYQLIQRESNFGLHSDPRRFPSQLYRERLRVAKNLYKTDLKGHFGCVNAIEFSHGGQYLASGGDDKRVLIWDIERSLAGISYPRSLATEQSSNIFCLGFDSQNRKLISGGNDALAISHDFETGKLDNVFKHEEPVYGLSIDPQNDSIFATASENGVVLLFDQRTDPADPLVVASLSSSFHAVEFHPYLSHLLVTANSKRGAALYDVRKPKEPLIQYVNLGNPRSCMSVRFNKTGNLILGLRRRLTPVLYNVNSPDRVCTFYHSYYYNSCTMKSCTFAGEDDELVISGSDDFNLYVWRLSDIDFDAVEQWVETTQMVLYGHRSIVNQVRYNREKCLLASSGVEKIVKIWSPFSQNNWSGSLTEEAICSENPRELYSPYNLFTMALPENWHHLSHDYSSENTNEDPRMMAFFDSLIQQEIEGWDTNESTSDTSQNEEQLSRSNSSSSRRSTSSKSDSESSSSSSSSSSSDSDSDNDNNKKPSALHSNRISRHAKRKFNPRTQQKPLRKQNAFIRTSPLNTQKNLMKPTNRIAYLIAKKSNTLRRLALKGSILASQRPHKRIDTIKQSVKRTSNSKEHKNRSALKQSMEPTFNSQSSDCIANNNINNIDEPCTSKAAATKASNSNITLSKIKEKTNQIAKHDNDSNYSSEEDVDVAFSDSSPCNNANIPSTSTGITSNFRDAFLRLSRQIFMSDSEDDSEEGNSDQQNGKPTISSSTESLPSAKKINGTNASATRPFEEDRLRNVVHETFQTSKRSTRYNRHKPKSTAALRISNTNCSTMLPQESNGITNKITSKDDVFNTDDCSSNSFSSSTSNSSSSSSSSISICTISRSSESNDSRIRDYIGRNSASVEFPKKRRCTEFSIEPQIDQTSSSSSSSSLSLCASATNVRKKHFQQDMTKSLLTSPKKQRKLSINDYIQVRTPNEIQEMEENNNETNNNDIFVIENNNTNARDQETPQRSPLESIRLTSYLNTTDINESNSISACFLTPDSGVSLNNSMNTPCTDGRNDLHGASTSHSSRISSRLSPCCENDGNVENTNNEVVHMSNRNTNFKSYQQKLARVRLNYRKHFLDENESD